MSHTPPPAAETATSIVNPTLLFVALMWGAGNLVTKWLLLAMDPPVLIAMRMGAMSLLMAGLLVFGRTAHISPRSWLKLGLLGGGLVAVQLAMFNYAMQMTTASEGSLLISTAPVWTAVIVSGVGMERVTGLNWIGIGIASFGVTLVILGPAGRIGPGAPARLPGDLLMLVAAWLYAAYMVVSRRWMRRFGEVPVIGSNFAAAGVLLLLWGGPELFSTDLGMLTWGHWTGIIYITFIAGFGGLFLWYRTIGRTSASGTAVYQYLVPGVSVTGAAVFLGERMSAVQIAGVVVTLVGVCLARSRP